MQQSSLKFWLFNGGFLIYLLASQPTAAQIVPDATLPNNSIVSPNCTNCEITGGTTVGNNLFHSFEQFSILTGGTAYFNNAVTIENIISRVTGKSVSNIDGLIRANGAANLLLINPNGIIFGPNASLDIRGSFVASTANSLKFSDGTELSATTTQATPLLTVSVPVGLGFGATPGRIVNRAALVDTNQNPVGLQIQSGKTLALVGGEVSLEGGFLTTPGGRIEVGSVASNNSVSLIPTNQGWVLGYEGIQNFQDISLSQAAFIGSNNFRGADIQIQGRQIRLTEGSQVNSVTQVPQAGNLKVGASESVELVGAPTDLFPTGLFYQVRGDATGEGRTLTIETGRLRVQGGAQVSTGTSGTGRGVDLRVSASELVELVGNSPTRNEPSGLFARVREGATGNGGTLTIKTRRLIVQDGAQVSSDTFGSGRAGDLSVSALESVELVGRTQDNEASGLSASNQGEPEAPGFPVPTGDAGDLEITTRRLVVLGGAQILTVARSGGQGGTLTINASDSVLLSGTGPKPESEEGRSGIFVSAESGANRQAGELNISTGQLTVEDGARISADNLGGPNNIGGNATLNVRQLIIRNGGQVRAGSFGTGPGGILNVNATESVQVIGSRIIGSTTVPSELFTEAQSSGDAGNLNITTRNLSVRNGAQVTVSSTGSGQAGEAGTLVINARSIQLDNSGSISADTKGGGGDITVTSPFLIMRRNSSITTNAEGSNIPGGNITLNTDILVALENSDISANSKEFQGGNVTINAQAIFGTQPRDAKTNESDITATGETKAGTIIINTPDVDPSSGLIQLPENFVDASSLVDRRCSPSNRASRFVVTGSGGLPSSPIAVLSGDAIDVNWVTLPQEKGRGAEEQRSRGAEEDNFIVGSRIVEAQGWVKGPNGEVILTAYPPTATSHNSWQRPIECP
ncbi:beta strand repeat-containing protein [Microseira wollei]|uniref:Filamentous hemagglutinin family outer membrane protein n=1 Tax=Microseira wollei NIES-4236 TaxID=2530354 RepID=A0AAV3X3L1_9CYAN|nr:S-layer family protein [Microseira wollei]GET36664.1 filamentous hemagglutinin family outer membrane protein [Microseira wollei NIES-4236]